MDRWIPVSERLPEDGRWVLLSFENAPLPDIGYLSREEDGRLAFTDGFTNGFADHGFIVNAWMELPKRYEGEKK